MATFPPLTPTERRYTTGQFKLDRRDDLSGASVRFLRAKIATGHRLVLPFTLASESEARVILDHYRAVQGSFVPFELPAATWCGTDRPLTGLKWRYAAPPQVQRVGPRTVAVEVTLISVTTALPSRQETPIEAGETGPMEAETPPAPPSDPYGTFFRGGNRSVAFSSDATFRVTTRVIDAAEHVPTVGFESDAEILFVRVISAGIPAVEITSDGSLAIFYGAVTSGFLLVGADDRGTPVGVLIGDRSFEVPADPSQTIEILLPSGLVITPALGAPEVEIAPIAFEALVYGGSAAIEVLLPSGLLVSSGQYAIGFNLGAEQAAQSAPIPIDGAAGSDLEALSRNGLETSITLPVLQAGEPDMPQRSATELALPDLEPAVGPSGDEARREGAATTIAFPVTVGTNLYDAFVDYTTASPDEDRGYQEDGGLSLSTPIVFAIGGTSAIDIPSRASQALAVSMQITVGSVLDAIKRNAQSVSISSVQMGFATTTEPAFSDRTP